MSRRAPRLLLGLGLSLVLAGCAAPVRHSGAKRVDFDRVDELLAIPGGTGVLLVESNDPDRISSVHVQRVRQWVEDGGVLWAAADGLDSALVRELAQPRVDGYGFRKTATGARGGELIVRGASPRLVIERHPLTEGVERLYLYPRRKFDGTPGAQPLVRMTDVDGEAGVVLAAVPLGDGFVVLDGTARERRLLFGRIRGFDEDRPNAIKLAGGWTSYDWERLLENASRIGGGA